jgi:hypothetical protein
LSKKVRSFPLTPYADTERPLRSSFAYMDRRKKYVARV